MIKKTTARKPGALESFFGIFSGIFSLISTVIKNRLNGIFYETFLVAHYRDEYDKLVDRKYQHFFEIRSQQPTTRNIKQFVDLLNDEAAWKRFEEEKMNKYFEDKIDLFPVSAKESAGAKGPRGPIDFEKPDDFFLIQMEMIRRRFPGGDVEGDIGDNDIRKLISCLRYVFRHNYFALIWSRRRWATAGVLASIFFPALILAGKYYSRKLWPDMNATEVYGFVAVVVFVMLGYCFLSYTVLRKFKELADEYTETVRHSCSVLARALEMRIQNIAAVIPLIFNEIDKGRYNYDNQEVRELWPQEVKKWSKLAFWMAARVEHIELFLQAQMWRIRRIHYGAKSIAVSVSWLLLLASSPLLGALVTCALLTMKMPDFLKLDGSDAVSIVSLAFVAFAVLMSVIMTIMSYKARTPDIDLIEKTIQTNKMPRNHDVKLYDEVARFLYREKKALLNEEDKLSGKKP